MAVSLVTQAQWGAVDLSFQPGGGNNAGLDADVFAIAVQPDGKILIGGNFTKIGRTGRNRVARLNADGSLDSSFDPGTGASGLVEVLVRLADGRVLIGGRFTTVQGQPWPYLARLHPTGGLDTSFNAAPDDLVLAAAVLPGGGVVIGGSFMAINGTPRSGIARLDQHGVLDPNFNLVLDSTVLIGGRFTSVNGVKLNYLARLTGDASVPIQFTVIEPTAADRVRLTVSAPEGAVCVLEGSTDCRSWVPALTNQAVAGTCVFEPLDWIGVGRRFYRVVRQ
jgi:uncharacterized delta-60 repeat protein